jgi:putative transposase
MRRLLKKRGIITVSVDEMTGIQALERAKETLPMKQKMLERPEYEYIRHGTQCLLAGFDVATGEVFSVCQDHRKEKDFVDFIKALEDHHYGYTQLQIVADNLNTHQSESLVRHVAERSGFEGDLGIKGKVGILKNQTSRSEFLSRKSHKIVFNYTPKHASWMNQIEIWFGILMRKVLKRGNFISTDELKSKLISFIEYHNEFYAHPYSWKYGNTVLKT